MDFQIVLYYLIICFMHIYCAGFCPVISGNSTEGFPDKFSNYPVPNRSKRHHLLNFRKRWLISDIAEFRLLAIISKSLVCRTTCFTPYGLCSKKYPKQKDFYPKFSLCPLRKLSFQKESNWMFCFFSLYSTD